MWNAHEIKLHINQQELLAVEYSLKNFFSNYKNCCIKIMTDNKTTMTYINNMGGKMQGCFDISRRIWEWAIERDLWLISAFIPGKYNIEADKLSRVLNENTEWSLNSESFQLINDKFPGISVDLFVSHLNNKLQNYCSWFPDEKAQFCDAFSISWSGFLGYAFPPFNLIGRVLRKVESEKCELVIVVPEWKTQYWYSKLLEMCAGDLFFLPRKLSTITNPLNARANRIRSRFIACKVSASRSTVGKSPAT